LGSAIISAVAGRPHPLPKESHEPVAHPCTPSHEILATLFGQSLLLTTDWSVKELEALLAVARRLEAADRAGVSTALFPHELAWALFFDKSTRTKSAWPAPAPGWA